ncbi:MAG TPA: hypothetical protein VK745_26185 [Polyangiaceae bacterium]|jgi:hypothetical protein|nr:hypothetical protein [Polyangiaceae bacterium]
MSTRGEDDSRPGAPFVSQRPTARDVPIAKYKEVSVGTSPPRGLRGPSLLPGQGAPERIVPEDIELAVLREADTLDGPQVARAAARRAPDTSSSPAPTPVSVEVPRVRSVPPSIEPYTTTPTTPSARSVQSGTLMSIGSIDPRAPTELSLPSPRALSQSERAAYLGPEAVVDRTPVSALPNAPRDLLALAQNVEFAAVRDAQASPYSEPTPQSSARSVPVGSGPPASSARRSQSAESAAPHAQHFGRAPQSYSPVSGGPARASQSYSPTRDSVPASGAVPPQFEIHSELAAVPHEFVEDNFDLRSAATQREPLASRKPMDSSDWTTVHAPISEQRDSAVPRERGIEHSPSSSSAITILVDPERPSVAPYRDSRASIPNPERVAPARASVPVSWVVGAAAFALALALLVAWVVRAPNARDAVRTADDRPQVTEPSSAHGSAAPLVTAPVSVPPLAAAQIVEHPATSASATVGAIGGVAKAPSGVLPIHAPDAPASSGSAIVRPAPAASALPARANDGRAAAPNATEAAPKSRQSIY